MPGDLGRDAAKFLNRSLDKRAVTSREKEREDNAASRAGRAAGALRRKVRKSKAGKGIREAKARITSLKDALNSAVNKALSKKKDRQLTDKERASGKFRDKQLTSKERASGRAKL